MDKLPSGAGGNWLNSGAAKLLAPAVVRTTEKHAPCAATRMLTTQDGSGDTQMLYSSDAKMWGYNLEDRLIQSRLQF